MSQTTAPSQERKTQVRVNPRVRRMIDHIAEVRDWKLNKVVEKAVTDFARREGIRFPDPKSPEPSAV